MLFLLLLVQTTIAKMKKLIQYLASIAAKLRDQEIRVILGVRILGSILVILSGLILFADKVTFFELENNFGFKSTKTFIWVLSQSLSPFLLLFAYLFKPFKSSFIVPIYIYTIQIYWIFKPSIQFDDYYLQFYAIGSCTLFMICSYLIGRTKTLHDKRGEQIEESLTIAKEILKTYKTNTIKA